MLSVIIPIYNEGRILGSDWRRFAGLSRRAELIFVDGGSSDRSVELASDWGKVLNCRKGRAVQMNFGAKAALNKALLFLHADAVVSPDSLEAVERKLRDNGFIGGCLTQRIDSNRFIFRLIEAQGNIRARRSGIFYGDQGIFVRKDVFDNLGGFPDVPIFEDVLFSQKLRKEGKTAILPDRITVSARRWEKKGIVRTTFVFSRLLLMFKTGYPLEKIKALYEDLR